MQEIKKHLYICVVHLEEVLTSFYELYTKYYTEYRKDNSMESFKLYNKYMQLYSKTKATLRVLRELEKEDLTNYAQMEMMFYDKQED